MTISFSVMSGYACVFPWPCVSVVVNSRPVFIGEQHGLATGLQLCPGNGKPMTSHLNTTSEFTDRRSDHKGSHPGTRGDPACQA